jgi:hypothetical protein
MRKVILPLPQYTFMAWCSVKNKAQGQLYLYLLIPEEKRSIGRTRRKWEDNIRMDLREIGRKSVDWIHLVHDRSSGWLL